MFLAFEFRKKIVILTNISLCINCLLVKICLQSRHEIIVSAYTIRSHWIASIFKRFVIFRFLNDLRQQSKLCHLCITISGSLSRWFSHTHKSKSRYIDIQLCGIGMWPEGGDIRTTSGTQLTVEIVLCMRDDSFKHVYCT